MERVFNEELMCILPRYVDCKGNCTILYSLKREPLIVEKSLRTVLRLIGKHYMLDLREIKKRYGPLVTAPNLVPIPFSKEDVFVPFKVRVPMYRNDGAFGYINMKYIERISKDKNSSLIYLSNGMRIKCLSSLQTVKKHMRNGKIVSRCYEGRSMKVKEEGLIYNAKLIVTK